MAIPENTDRLTAALSAHDATDALIEALGPKRAAELLLTMVVHTDRAAKQQQPVNRARSKAS